MKNTTKIIGLYYFDKLGHKQYYYIGTSTKNTPEEYKQKNKHYPLGINAKSDYNNPIRIDPNVEWFVDILYTGHNIFIFGDIQSIQAFFIIYYIQRGHPILNQYHGWFIGHISKPNLMNKQIDYMDDISETTAERCRQFNPNILLRTNDVEPIKQITDSESELRKQIEISQIKLDLVILEKQITALQQQKIEMQSKLNKINW